MRLTKAIERMTAQTTGFGTVGRATGEKITPADCAFICRGIQSDAWDAARLHWGDDRRGVMRLMDRGYSFAQRANEQDKWNFKHQKLWRLTGVALAEFGSPQRIWITNYVVTHGPDGERIEAGEEMRSVKWTQEVRAGLFGSGRSQWFNQYSKPYQTIYSYFDGFLSEAGGQVGRNERRKKD